MIDRVEWSEHGRHIIAERTDEGKWEIWEKDGYENRWDPCRPVKRLIAKANRKLAAKRCKAHPRSVAA